MAGKCPRLWFSPSVLLYIDTINDQRTFGKKRTCYSDLLRSTTSMTVKRSRPLDVA